MAIALVLAGGLGSRLGGCKPAALLDGIPLIAHVLGAARAGGLEPVVVAKADSPLPPLDCRLVVEPALPLHPLCGIIAGLEATGAASVVVCPTDMPRLTGGLLAWLDELVEPLAVVRGQPLLGRYAATLLPELAAALPTAPPMHRLVERLGARLIDERELRRFGDPGLLLANVNTAGELARARGVG
jgi:molybdopterin-guanine dinucleotide biosynthesis protein A